MERGIDVPMLLAKLRDYGARTKDLEGQVRRLTNVKLNELVLRSTLGPLWETKVSKTPPICHPSPTHPAPYLHARKTLQAVPTCL
jgi:hypothetical protein